MRVRARQHGIVDQRGNRGRVAARDLGIERGDRARNSAFDISPQTRGAAATVGRMANRGRDAASHRTGTARRVQRVERRAQRGNRRQRDVAEVAAIDGVAQVGNGRRNLAFNLAAQARACRLANRPVAQRGRNAVGHRATARTIQRGNRIGKPRDRGQRRAMRVRPRQYGIVDQRGNVAGVCINLGLQIGRSRADRILDKHPQAGCSNAAVRRMTQSRFDVSPKAGCTAAAVRRMTQRSADLRGNRAATHQTLQRRERSIQPCNRCSRSRMTTRTRYRVADKRRNGRGVVTNAG